MITIDILRKAGCPDELIVRILQIEQSEKLDKIREQTRIRVQNFRARNASNDRNALPTLPALQDPAYTKKERKKEREESKYMPEQAPARARKILLPEDFTLNETDRAACRDLAWTPEKTETELMRFRDHAATHGRRCIDWHAAWRNWVRSPFQSKQANGGMNGYHGTAKPNAADVLRGIVEDNRRRESPDFGGLLPKIGRG